MNKNISISVIVPALNEEQNLKGAVSGVILALKGLKIDGEIIIVNDGSTDATGKIADELSKSEKMIRVLHHGRPMGVGYSFRDGVSCATKKAVTFIPGDGENDPTEVLKYIAFLEHADIIVPFVVNKEIRPKLRRFLTALFVLIVNFTFRTAFRYTNGNVIYKTAIFKTVKQRSNGFFFQAECLVKAVRSGFTFAQVPIRIRTRTGGESKALSSKSLGTIISEYLRLLFVIYFSAKP